jgi:membrane associated rhomboid family serine protease
MMCASRRKRQHWSAGLVTWCILVGTILLWVATAVQAAQIAGAHTVQGIIHRLVLNTWTLQPPDEKFISEVVLCYGAKDNTLILRGQYWRFLVPIFLHLNALHLILNMANFVFLGLFLERLCGHVRFTLIYLICGVVSYVASFYFSPNYISIGASGAIFGLIGAYGAHVFKHRQGTVANGFAAILNLVVVVSLNLSIGFLIQGVDNAAHVGGLICGFILGWLFTPFYEQLPSGLLVETHSLARRWLWAVLTILGTLLLIVLALYLFGMKS